MTIDLNRREVMMALAALGVALPGSRALAADGDGLQFGPAEPFSFDALVEKQRALAAAPYVPEASRAPAVLDRIDFDQHWRIKYKADETLQLNDGKAPIRFFHLGRYFQLPVGIHVVEGGTARTLRYDPALFDIPADSPAKELPADIGFAGFRVLEPGREEDWLAFLGAAYFRTSGEDNQFGMSARALAIDVAMPTPEEFPRFTDFFLEPSADGRLVITCALNSPRVAGVLRMDVSKGGPIRMDIQARYFARGDIQRFGIAALTSMFWYSETDRARRVDWRPEVHDSDGLALWTGTGERIWRPLNNPRNVMTSSFSDEAPRGFGLLQRDRNFENYEDDGVFYEKRASVWVEPVGSWGRGAVQLVEIPTDDEIHDNIAAYWVPETPVRRGDAVAVDYRLFWSNREPYPGTVGKVAATRLGRGGIPGQPRPAGVTKVVVDFDGGLVAALGRDAKGVKAIVTASRGTVGQTEAYSVKVGTAWRATFDLTAEGDAPVELRLYLTQGESVLTETWAYQFLPLGAA
ncbi:glucan biosynthesis protein [Aureimonas pseudogalii]|uniref:Glucans biosynthesis protein n=1 Tax=Aureimonas pseudogalii TaxID=1744844 RepID=A0A7W6EB41_9HYPH|nr:glucan biosynthesis protein D [Aureimonas pseudogalii]MBB3997584.1 glucans biosynthesis protein [Aureimonas pseudogalii]